MKTRNNAILTAVILSIVAIGVGYAALAQQLTITGIAGTGSASWVIQFKSITKNTTLTTSGANEENPPTASGTSATFDVSFDHPGSKIVYDIVVENAGTIDASFVEISGLDTVNEIEPVDIKYTVEKTDADVDLLNGLEDTYRVTIEWKSDSTAVPTTTSKTATIHLDYIQKVV